MLLAARDVEHHLKGVITFNSGIRDGEIIDQVLKGVGAGSGARVKVPALLVRGAQDGFFSSEQIDAFAARFENAKMAQVQGGHGVPEGAATKESVAGFLREIF